MAKRNKPGPKPAFGDKEIKKTAVTLPIDLYIKLSRSYGPGMDHKTMSELIATALLEYFENHKNG